MDEHCLGFLHVLTQMDVTFASKMEGRGEGLSNGGHVLSNGIDGRNVSKNKCGSTSDSFR